MSEAPWAGGPDSPSGSREQNGQSADVARPDVTVRARTGLDEVQLLCRPDP